MDAIGVERSIGCDAADAAYPVVEHWFIACSLDGVLVEVAQAVTASTSLSSFGPAGRLRAGVLARIQERIALPLAAAVDWRRGSALSCACQYCMQLAQFLDDPCRDSWTLKAAETHRRHVLGMIQRHGCDVDCATVRQGSPHGLVCTKNQASYDALRRQRAADLVLVAQLVDAGRMR